MLKLPNTHKLPYSEKNISGLTKDPDAFLKYMKALISSLQAMYIEIANAMNVNAGAMTGVKTAADNDATPSILNAQFLVVNYSSATTITDFPDEKPGQLLHVLQTAGAGTVTIADNANIKTNTDGNKNMVKERVYTFRSYSGVWYEVA